MILKNYYGQTHIINEITNLSNNDCLGHAYIFEGPTGIGKRTLAKNLSKYVLCMDDNKICEECNNCILINNNNHPDIKTISSDSSISIDSIRDVIKDINIKSYYGKRKIYIIENAHNMTINAQNSILKTLEEPPPFVTLILTTNNLDMLLPTIISRCSIKKFKRNTNEEIIQFITNKYPGELGNREVLLSLCDGIIGNVESLFENDLFNKRKEIFIFLQEILTGTKTSSFELSKKMISFKDNIDLVLNIMVLFLRDILIMKICDEKKVIINIDYHNEICELAKKFSVESLKRLIYQIIKTQNNLEFNANFNLSMETLTLKINSMQEDIS